MQSTVAQAESAVNACTEPSQQPTKSQVAEIAQMTRSGGSVLDRIQQALFERLVHSDRYHWREIEHTLVVIQQCSFIGAFGFYVFFKEQVYAIAALTNYQSPSLDAETIARVQGRARLLSQLLQDEERIREERSKSIIPDTSDITLTQTTNPQARDHDKILKCWRDWRITPAIAPPPASASLPTPDPSPLRGAVPLEEENKADEDRDTESTPDSGMEDAEAAVRAATENTPSDIIDDQINEMIEMTFDKEDLVILVGVLVERLFAREGQIDHRHLVKSLVIINQCLLRGSVDFTSWFRANRELIASLCAFPVLSINQLARLIIRQLDGDDVREADQHRQPSLPVAHPVSSAANQASSPGPDMISLHQPVKDLTTFVITLDTHPIGFGGYSYVYRATLTLGSMTELVAKKVLKCHQISPDRLQKRVKREVQTWTQLTHPNIAEFYGITHETNGSIGLVSPFFKKGNIVDFINSLEKGNVDVLKLMIEVTSGVDYLHEKNIVHGDIKGSNIMIDDLGHTKLIDFGLARITGDESGNTTSGLGISLAWAAPELFLEPDDIPAPKTKASDVYAVAITFTEESRTPFYGLKHYAIINKVKHGGVPDRPYPGEECNFFPEDNLWALLLCCWACIPDDRPTIRTVLDELHSVSGNSQS